MNGQLLHPQSSPAAASPLAKERRSSTLSTISTDSDGNHKFPVAPFKPKLDPAAWSSWIADYQSGNWTESANHLVSHDSLNKTPRAEALGYAQSFRFNTSSELEKKRHCTKKDRAVHCDDGKIVDSFDFYRQNGWLAPPQVPRLMRLRCNAALRRHHVTGPHGRDALNLYIKHAKAVFKVDYASFMVASPNDADMLILAQDGGKAEVQRVNRAVTLCAHAMLLDQDELLVIPDTSQDWRFSACPSTNIGTPCNQAGNAMRFYASAPLYLSYNIDGIEGSVQAGRLCIMSREIREFTEEDGELLLSIAKMASDAFEKEHQSKRNAKVAEMQRRSSRLIRSMEDPKVLAHPRPTDYASSEASEGKGLLKFSMQVIDMVCDELREYLGAEAVAAVDITGFRLKNIPKNDLSPKASAYPMTPWQTTDANDLAGPLTPPAELDGLPASVSPISPLSSPKASRDPLLRARGSYSDDVELNEQTAPPQLLAFSGNEAYTPQLQGSAQARSICEYIGRAAKEDKMAVRSKQYRLAAETPFLDEDGDVDSFASSRMKPLSAILPSDVPIAHYIAVPIFGIETSRPIFFLLVMSANDDCVEEQEHLFVEACANISMGSIVRQKALDVDSIQAEFLRHVQHNLRTPLHGALGAVDYLRGAIAGDEDDEHNGKLDLSADGVLATLLDSIALSGSTLNTYIDDLLSFQNLAGLRPGARSAKVTSTDLVKVVEEVCNEEWELAQRLEMQSQRLDIDILGLGGPLTTVELIAKASRNVADCEWMVDVKAIRQAVRKVVSNAIRFTRQGYVEVSLRTGEQQPGDPNLIPVEIQIQDTGVGMTREFCADQLTRPFTKGDSFRDGIGLGMTIVSSTVQNMGGKLLVSSEVNVGTRVSMIIPMAPSAPVRKSSDASIAPPPFAVKRIAYVGMDTRGLRRLANSICEHLSLNKGLELVQDPRGADCVVIPDTSMLLLSQGPEPLIDQLKLDARIVVIAKAPHFLRPEGLEVLKHRAVLPYPLPHGPSSLKLMETFLREAEPPLLRMSGLTGRRSQMRSSISTPSDSLDVTYKTDTDSAAAKRKSLQTTGPAKTLVDPSIKDGDFRVLVVEDNPINMKLLTTLLKRLNIVHDEAHDGAEAVSKFISFKPAVVLLDISLPIQDGFEACTQMRAHQHPSHIVAITALSSEQDRIRGIETCGMNAWITKPVSTRQLKQDLISWRKDWDDKH